MNTKKYMQTDSAWSGLGYPSYPCNVGRDGCGMVSIANILIEMEQYAQYTPATIQPYCRQYASPDCEGTYWAGIPKMMEHYGLTEVMEHQNMASLWKELAKGGRVAIYMMGSSPGGSLGIHWTSGGHFIASVGYRYQDGDHQVYVKDSYSNSKQRNGWLGYFTHLRGDVRAVWSGKLVGTPTPPPTPPKPGELVVDGICGENTVMAMQQAFGVGIDGIISGQMTKWKNYYPSITAISFEGGGSQVIWKLQEWLNLSDPDGILGPNTTKAWQKRLRDYGYFANPQETIDGIIGAKTMKAWQECLNNGLKPKSSPTPPTPTPTKKTKMIDVSDFQSNIDWNKVKADGIDAAIIRVGGRGGEAGVIYDDSDFFENIKGAYKAGLSVGIYFLTQAITPEEGREEAQRTIKRWTESGIPISYPIGIDSEDVSWKNPDGTIGYGRANSNKLSKAKRTAAIKAFADECKRQGYPSMLYASTNWLYDDVDMSVLSPLMDVWCAQWASSCSYTGKYIIWQYSSSGAVSGIKGRVDMDWCYVDPKQMNPPTPTPTPTPSGGEHYPGPYPVVKYYLEPGDKGENVTRLQNYLNWYTDGEFFKECGEPDGVYGKNTLKYANKMLTDFFGASEADGKVGPKTIAKMKAYTKPVKPTPTPKPYSGAFPSEAEIRQAASNGIREGIRAWCYDIFKSGKYGYKIFDNEPAPGFYCPICKPGTGNGWNCIGYSFASWRHGGGIPCTCNCGVIWDGLADRYINMSNIDVLKSMQSRIGTDDIKLIRNNNRAIPRTQLQMGDLLMFYRGSTYAHMGVYIGNGKVSDDANPSEGIRYGEPLEDFYPVLFAIRYTGTRSYLKLHDSGTAVAKWQDYLDWWSDGAFYKECGKGDGIFGANTDKWTKKFQEEVMGKGQGDGLVGMKTITAAKKVKK